MDDAEEQFDRTVDDITTHIDGTPSRVRANGAWAVVNSCNKMLKVVSEEVELLNECLRDLDREEDNGFKSVDLEEDIHSQIEKLERMAERVRKMSEDICKF
jgi:DNA-binding transcriptional regulator GbsR (MarR family)